MKQNPLLDHLNESQEQAVKSLDTNVLVVAGPGTGKTRVLTARIAWLLEQGVPPEEILAITFTNKAAGEMLERIKAAGLSRHIPITTFHSWAFHFLKNRLPAGRGPVVISENEQKQIFKHETRSLGIQGKTGELFERLQFLKQFYPPRLQDEPEELVSAWDAYHEYLHSHDLYDYDDLILSAISALEEECANNPLFQPYAHLLVDEFQDASHAQYKLCRLLAGKACRVMAIGDPNQSIYGFRGSDPGLMESFRQDFTPCSRITLTTAYRCPQKFIDAAWLVLKTKGRTRLRSAKAHRGRIMFRQFMDHGREAAWIARKIDNLTGGISFESLNQGTASGQVLRSLSEVAVMFRINRLGENIATELEKIGIPFQRSLKMSPLSEKRLNRLWHLLEFLENRRAAYHLSMFLPMEQQRLRSLSAERRTELLKMGGDAFLEAASEIFEFHFAPAEKSIFENALEYHRQGRPLSLALRTEQDCLDFRIEAVSLLSLHASKGLEFPVVFIAGCDRNIIPWEKGDISEERRLFYVGLTRSSEQVFITCARKRSFWGRTMKTGPSPFLNEIEPLVSKGPAGAGRKKKKKRSRQKKLF